MSKNGFVMLVYGVLLIGMGILAYQVAPAGASAITALAVPGLAGAMMIVCVVLSMMDGVARRVGGVGGIVIALLFAAAVVGRAAPSTAAYMDAKDALGAAMGEAPDDESDDAREARRAAARASLTGEQRDALDKGYLVMSLWGLTSLSALAFVALLMLGVRRVEPREAVNIQVDESERSDG